MNLKQLLLMPIAAEWIVWYTLTARARREQRCAICRERFFWDQLITFDLEGHKLLPKTSFPCPKCKQTIGVPGWRRPAMKFLYIAFLLSFLAMFFELNPPNGGADLFTTYAASLFASLGAVRIADWFIWQR